MIVLLIVVLAVIALYAVSSIINFRNNRKYREEEPITDQKNPEKAGRLRFGFFDSGYNGCGWIAVYNALVFLGRKPRAERVVLELEWLGAILFGTFGIFPFSVTLFFRRRGYKVKVSRKKEEFDRLARESGASILLAFRGLSAHYVAVKGEDGGFTVPNLYAGREKADKLDSLSQIRVKRSVLLAISEKTPEISK